MIRLSEAMSRLGAAARIVTDGINFMNKIFLSINNDVSPRVRHLSVHAKKQRHKKKNLNRIRRQFICEIKRNY